MATFFGGAGTNDFTIAANFCYFFRAICNATGNVTDGRAYYNSGTGNMKLAVYADSSGAPGTKLGESGVIDLAPGGTGFKTTTFASPFAVTNGTQYWLAWLCDAGPHMGNSALGDNFRFLAATYPTFPLSGSGAGSSSAVTGGLQVGVTVGGGGGSTFVPMVVIVS